MRRLVVLALALGLAACGDDSSGPGAGSNQLVVGALLSLTGPGQTLGRTSEAALQLAADDLNAQLSSQGSPTRVSVRVEDTGLDPTLALDRLRALAGEGVRIFIGPQSSSEVGALKPFADSAGVVLMSQGSTASALSIADDNVFRLVPDDSQEGQAMVALLGGDGIQTVVPLWREDAGNQGLHDAVERLFPEQGGTVTAGAHYPPATTDFSAQLEAIRSQVGDAVAQNGAATVAVYLAAFEESAAIFAQASQDPTLSQVQWYGGDGTVQSAAVVADPAAAGFAASTAFRAPTYGLDDELLQQDAELIGAIQARSGLSPDAFTLAAYDALHVATLAYAEVGLGSIEEYRAELLRQAGTYTGATGPTTLNPAGDRAIGDYDFYQVCASAPPSWRRVEAYRATPGTVVNVGAC
ncbi:MAG TPA: ABC transporter substrate-binding protein [Gemmatimonadales bacterium]|jgi:branched-chain amino acid transport system substrate-binding protein|nr:ABC transporter substrate-binding protein [Gemmatimonadales bacterium]